MTTPLVAFFAQFEPGPGWQPIIGSRAWWDRLMASQNGKLAAQDFRERMKLEHLPEMD